MKRPYKKGNGKLHFRGTPPAYKNHLLNSTAKITLFFEISKFFAKKIAFLWEIKQKTT